MASPNWWSVPRGWEGETVFIVAGGPSVLQQDIGALRGHRVIAINSAWKTAPFADVLLFGDARWWREYGAEAANVFGGEIVTTCSVITDKRVRNLVKAKPPQPAMKPTHVIMNATTVTAGIDYAKHSGAARAILLGVDGRLGPNGERHHHGVKYPWPLKPDSFERHAKELAASVPLFEAAGIEVLNASPVGVIPNIRNVDFKDLV